MSAQNNGGTAFPQYAKDPWGNTGTKHAGMTLRDYFAAKAMQAMLSDIKGLASLLEVHGLVDGTIHAGMARIAYVAADAMLAEGAK